MIFRLRFYQISQEKEIRVFITHGRNSNTTYPWMSVLFALIVFVHLEDSKVFFQSLKMPVGTAGWFSGYIICCLLSWAYRNYAITFVKPSVSSWTRNPILSCFPRNTTTAFCRISKLACGLKETDIIITRWSVPPAPPFLFLSRLSSCNLSESAYISQCSNEGVVILTVHVFFQAENTWF